MFASGSILHRLGRYGPFIMFIASLVIMKAKVVTTQAYIAGFVINTLINPIMKLIIKQRRPDRKKSTSMLSACMDTSKNPNDLKYPPSFAEQASDAHKYGMPSGHAQTAVFTLVYIWLAYNQTIITTIFAILTLITCTQRIVARKHYIDQVICGAIIGGMLAFFFFHTVTSILKGL